MMILFLVSQNLLVRSKYTPFGHTDLKTIFLKHGSIVFMKVSTDVTIHSHRHCIRQLHQREILCRGHQDYFDSTYQKSEP